MMVQALIWSTILYSLVCTTMTLAISPSTDILETNHRFRRENSDVNYTKIINFWEEHKNEFIFDEDYKEVVLVMGNTGAGKTTLISALVGRKLKAVNEDGYLVFVDEDGKIGTGTSSKTLVPEIMVDIVRNMTFVDCSGFRDNRDVEYEVSSVYFQNILMEQIEKIKLILMINYDSLKFNGNKNDFDDLFEHVGEFIKNLTLIHNSVAMVATKIENLYVPAANGSVVLSNPDELVMRGIARYLTKKKETYLSKTEDHEKYQMFANLIDVLLENHENEYTRIGLFRQPEREGPFEDLPKSVSQINTIGNMAKDNLQFVETTKDDFGFALSKSLKHTVDQIVDDIFQNTLSKRLKVLGNETLTYYLQMEEEYNDIEILRERTSQAHDTFVPINNVEEPQQLFKEFFDASNVLDIPLPLTSLDIISDDIQKLFFFTTISDSNSNAHMLILKDEMQTVINSIKDLKNFYDFLHNLQERLDVYTSQSLRDDNRIKVVISSCATLNNPTLQDITNLENIVREIGSYPTYQEVGDLKLNRFQLKHLKAVFEAFSTQLEVSCTSEQMIVKGYNVKMTEVVNDKCWSPAKVIQIFALNKLFIDGLVDKTGAEAQLSMFAPTWDIVGGPKILLDGQVGKRHEKDTAKSSSFNSENGSNGLPGFPGGPAGHFFGVGREFINPGFLEIHGNGGTGGPGQHGGNGADGKPGEALPELFFDIRRDPRDIKRYLGDNHYPYEFPLVDSDIGSGTARHEYRLTVQGKPGVKPSDGGDGGAGGLGGYTGEIVIDGLGESVDMKTFNNSGSTGPKGQGGHGGRKTSEGRIVKCYYEYRTFPPPFPWTSNYWNIRWLEGAEIPQGKDGNVGSNEKNQQHPTPASPVTLYPAINSFKSFVRENLFNNTKESALKSFIQELEGDDTIKAQYSTVAFVREYEGLENQFLELRNKINFVPFYNSLLTRIEEYAENQQSLENKKVLNYIYTAALTKIFGLKKKRTGTTVVDLSKYLGTIENSVKEIQEAQQLQVVQKYRDDYKDNLNKKIREAEGFIHNSIDPEIDGLWDDSDNQMKAIIDEINENKESTIAALEKLERDKSKIRGIMQTRGMLLPLKIAGAALSLFGPIGAGIGVAVTGVASIADGMLVGKPPGVGPTVPSIDPHLKEMSRVIKTLDETNVQSATTLSVAVARSQEFIDNLSATPQEKRAKREIIDQLKAQLEEIKSKQPQSLADVVKRHDDIEVINKKLAEFAETEKKELEKPESENKKDREKSLQQIKNVQTIINSAKVVFDFANQIKNDQASMSLLDNQASKYYQQLRDLEEMENQMYEIIIPDLRAVEETINEIKNAAGGASHAQLDIAKWTVKKTLKELKLLLQKFTQKMSFELQSNLMHYIERIDEAFSILIDIYDRIDSYSDSVQQAEYMANIVSTSMTNIHISDPKLSRAVTDLRLVIQTNILLEKYATALSAFKQHFFPFAARVLQRFELPGNVQPTETELMRSNIIERIKDMKNHIDESESTIGEYSKYIHERKIFNSNTTGSQPLFIWKYDNIKNQVEQLLSGSEIILKADISKGLFLNSIKYNDIGINFNLINDSLQSSLNSKLKNFALTMAMIGNNYYRCGERYYFISFDDDITISYTLAQDENKNWIDPNKVYTTIRDSHTFLSPYVMWSIKLTGINNVVSFNDLKPYVNETIDLELFGRGYYIEQNPTFNFEVCTDYLKTFYDVETFVKELV